jgi:negative regulator of sigma E activity
MSEQQDKLSSLMDEFSGDEQSRRMLDEVEGDVNLQYRLRRYQMIGQVMRHELPRQIDTEFSANVMAKIDATESGPGRADTVRPETNTRRSIWTWPVMKPFAGLAVALSVAVVSVTLWQSVDVGIDTGQSSEQLVSADQKKIKLLARQQVQTSAVPVTSSFNSGMRWKINDNAPALQQKLNAYLVNHTEYSNSIQGLIPQARVAGYDAQQ